jgi:hypothetical protein
MKDWLNIYNILLVWFVYGIIYWRWLKWHKLKLFNIRYQLLLLIPIRIWVIFRLVCWWDSIFNSQSIRRNAKSTAFHFILIMSLFSHKKIFLKASSSFPIFIKYFSFFEILLMQFFLFYIMFLESTWPRSPKQATFHLFVNS